MRLLLPLIAVSFISACGGPMPGGHMTEPAQPMRYDVMERARDLSMGGRHDDDHPTYGRPGDTPRPAPIPPPCDDTGLGDRPCP